MCELADLRKEIVRLREENKMLLSKVYRTENKCTSCNGNGYVLGYASQSDPDELEKEPCTKCKGKGYL